MEYLIIQVEESRVTVARFGLSGKAATLAGAASFAVGPEQDLPAVASQIAAGISGSPRIVLCLSPSLFAQRSLELPLTDLRKVREVLPARLQGEIVLPVEEAVFEALPAGSGNFLVLWAKQADIAHVIDIFKEAGLEPQFVTSIPFAWNFLPGIAADCAVSDGNALAVIKDGYLSYAGAINRQEAGKQLVSTLAALELSGSALPARLFVTGQQASELALLEGLPLKPEKLELPDDLAIIFRNDDTFQQLAGLYAVAKACRDNALPDFRRGKLAWTAGKENLQKKLYLTAALVLIAVLLLFISKGLQYREAKSDLASLNASISAIYHGIFPARAKAVDELAEIKGEIRKMTGVENSNGFLDLLKKLAQAKGTTINGLYEAELDGRTLRIKGDARSADAVNEFKLAITPLMDSVEMGEIKTRPDGMVIFSMTGALKEGKR